MARAHTVRQGDCIYSISAESGFFPDTIWSHPDNADLKELRKDPHVLCPGDVVVVPDRREKEVNRETGAVHQFVRKGVPKRLRVRFFDQGEPVAGLKCRLNVDGRQADKTTDGDGWLEHWIPLGARRATVELESGDTFELDLGHLDPVGTARGIQQRLRNLGVYEGPIDGEEGPALRAAIAEFQRREGLDQTGEADSPTKDLLIERNEG